MGLFSGKKKPELYIDKKRKKFVEQDLMVVAKYFGTPIQTDKQTIFPTTEVFNIKTIRSIEEIRALIVRIAELTSMSGTLEVEMFVADKKGYETITVELQNPDSGTHRIFLQSRITDFPVHFVASVAQQFCEIKIEKLFTKSAGIQGAGSILSMYYGFGAMHMLSLYRRSEIPHLHLCYLPSEEILYCMAMLDWLGVKSIENVEHFLSSDRMIQLKELRSSIPGTDDISEFTETWRKNILLSADYQITKNCALYDLATLEAYERLHKTEPDNNFLRHNLAYCRILHGKFEEALIDLDFVIDNDPYSAYGFNNRGYCHLMLNNLEDALHDLTVSRKLNPKNSFEYRNMGIYWLKRNKPELAIDELLKAHQMDANTEHIHYWLGSAYLALGQKENAAEEFQLSKSVPELPTPLYPT